MIEGRRTLTFSRLDEVMPEVDRLLKGHRTLGQWSLGQICNHLAGVIVMGVDGPPVKLPWILRKTVGPLIVGWILKKGRFPNGVKIPRKYEPKPGLDARAEAEALRAAIRLYSMHTGPMADHPLAGQIPRATWDRLECIHCAHHLGFVVPDEAA
ncbi:DUF1569 domain-containing protein [Tundrisphaera lichenicola]|uniref:DUF1569 domain-containing protein n=1 Tax=Tundrisphaera lichenicola TaxID=2029860 RepID=UPI003EB812AC